MIKIITSIEYDGYTCPVTTVATRPMVGDYVFCFYFKEPASLRIETITHTVVNGEPFLKLELKR